MLLEALGHEQLNHQAFQSWLQNGGNATVMSYGHQMPPRDHIEWMKSLPFYYDLGDYWLVHAGVDPRRQITQQSPDQFCWIRREFHSSRKPYFEDKTIVIGHTITFTFDGVEPGQLVKGKGWLGIDTGVYHHGQGCLTAFDLSISSLLRSLIINKVIAITIILLRTIITMTKDSLCLVISFHCSTFFDEVCSG